MTDVEAIAELSRKIDTLIRIQAALAIKNEQSQKDKIVFLYGAGISPTEIADIIGTSANTVMATMSKHKKVAKAKGGAKK